MTVHDSIQTLIASTEAFDQQEQDIILHLNKMHTWHQQLAINLNKQRINPIGLTSYSQIAQDIAVLNSQLESYLSHWETQLETLHAAQSIADHFDDKIILLIFGKFNAGKSSFCNVLAECF
ncbi:MAG: dGTPase, partial [Acinetobacter sp.]|nr:dGTPase [Acinetobacter sp.]